MSGGNRSAVDGVRNTIAICVGKGIKDSGIFGTHQQYYDQFSKIVSIGGNRGLKYITAQNATKLQLDHYFK